MHNVSIRPNEQLIEAILDVTSCLGAGVNPVDCKIRKGEFFKFTVARPKIPGGDLAGVIEEAPEQSKVILLGVHSCTSFGFSRHACLDHPHSGCTCCMCTTKLETEELSLSDVRICLTLHRIGVVKGPSIKQISYAG